MPLTPHLQLVRLRAELALLRRLNAGYGFDSRRTPSELFLYDEAARERLGGSPLRPRDTHDEPQLAVEAELARLEQAWPEEATRLTTLCDRFDLDAAERALVEIVVAYQLDPDTRALCDTVASRRAPALYGDVCQELAPELATAAELLRITHPSGRLRRGGLIEVIDDTLDTRHQVLGCALGCSRRVLDWLAGDERIAAPLDAVMQLFEPDQPGDVFLPEPVLAEVEAAVSRLSQGHGHSAVLLQGPGGAGKQALARRIAAALDRPLLAASIDRVRGILFDVLREARMRGAVLYLANAEAFAGDDGKLDRGVVYALDHYDDVLVLGTRRGGRQSLPLARPFQLIRLPQPDLDTRKRAWAEGLRNLQGDSELGEQAAAMLATRYVVGAGIISEVLREADAFAVAHATPVSPNHIEEALGRQLSIELGSFGSLVTRRASFHEMVLPEDVMEVLRSIIAMVRERSRILESWGYGRHLGITRGVSALFAGEPGTGKTMAASVISSELGLELMRIDLSAVVSKWVGETEKHLAKIFDEAQNANAMLLFDEADSLFGKRTEAKSAQDRYANLEVNYVLQRMETFDGISILTTNMESGIDPAFLRRLNFRVRFPEPEVEERIELWRRLLPPDTNIASEVNFEALADRFEMTGGHIRNAIVRAAVIAAREGREMQGRDLLLGAHLEYEELGKVMPAFDG